MCDYHAIGDLSFSASANANVGSGGTTTYVDTDNHVQTSVAPPPPPAAPAPTPLDASMLAQFLAPLQVDVARLFGPTKVQKPAPTIDPSAWMAKPTLTVFDPGSVLRLNRPQPSVDTMPPMPAKGEDSGALWWIAGGAAALLAVGAVVVLRRKKGSAS